MAEAERDPGIDPESLFFAVSFTIIRDHVLNEEASAEIIRVMEENGARYTPLDPETGRAEDITLYSHIISRSSDFPDYETALDHFVHVVKPSWVESSLLKKKALNPRQWSPDPRLFLSDVTVTCAEDIPEGDKEAIIGGVLAMGGQYSAPLSKLATHLVALSMDDPRCQLAKRKNLKCVTVLPHWFDDCLKLGKMISEGPYLLPNPEILSRSTTAPKASHANDALRGAVAPVPDDLPTPATSPQRPRMIDVFRGKNLMLSGDLNLGSRMQATIETLIRNGGGELVTEVDTADIYVCYHRDGEDYIKASQQGKDVGNLAWLYHLITYNAWTSPMRRLLHYPVPRKGIPGFDKFSISLSNYVGDARVYLENLIKACGAEFSRTMRQDHTHLITAHPASEKCDAAREWNINIVNHLWLEESYAKCQVMTISNPRYTTFPSRTNLGEVVGQTHIDREAVKAKYFTAQPNTALRKGPATNGVVQPSRRPKLVSLPKTTAPTPEEPEDAEEPEEAKAHQKDNDHTEIETAQVKPPAAKTKVGRGKSDQAHLRTPAAKRIADAIDNEPPSTSSSRSAKAKALSALHDLAPDIALYEKESKRVGGVIHGGRKGSNPELAAEKAKLKKAKRSLEPEDEDEEEVVSNAPAAVRKTKKARNSDSQFVHHLMLTGDDRWKSNMKKEHADRNKLRAMGINLTETPSDVTILCSPRILRTKKFVAALAAAPYVCGSDFLDYCLEHGKIPMPEEYRLRDPEGEKKFGFAVRDTICRAKQNHGKLLQGWQIFVTQDVAGGFDSFKEIIQANSGSCHLWKGRATAVQKRSKGGQVDADGDKNMEDDEEGGEDGLEENRAEDEGDTLYLISGTNPEDVKLWKKFRNLAKKADMTPRIVHSDWLLAVTMSQKIMWDDRFEIRESEVPGIKR